MTFVTHECPRCDGTGTLTTLESASFDGIGAHMPAILEIPCPTCGARMDAEGEQWTCPICASTRPLPREGYISRITDSAYPEGSGKPGVFMGECPACGSLSSVNGDPDGALECNDCGDFYAGRFSTEWFAYVDWVYGGAAVVNERSEALS